MYLKSIPRKQRTPLWARVFCPVFLYAYNRIIYPVKDSWFKRTAQERKSEDEDYEDRRRYQEQEFLKVSIEFN